MDRRRRELADHPPGVDEPRRRCRRRHRRRRCSRRSRRPRAAGLGGRSGSCPAGTGTGRSPESSGGRTSCSPSTASTETIAGAVAVLESQPGVVEHDASGAGDLRILEGRERLRQPLRLGQRIVVDERDEVAGGGTDADVAGDRQVPLRVVEVADPVPPRLEDLEGVVGRRSVDDDHLEVAVALVRRQASVAPRASARLSVQITTETRTTRPFER